MEWINTAWTWIETNITPLLTTANITMVLGVIFSIWKQKRSLLDNTVSNKELKETMNIVSSQKETLDAQNDSLESLKAENENLKETVANMAIKSDAVLDILHTVYMAQNISADAKNVIETFYTNARYAETQQRAEILKQVEDLKAQLASMTAAMSDNVKKTAEKIKKTVGAEKTTVNLK